MKSIIRSLLLLALWQCAAHADPSRQDRLERLDAGLRTNGCDTDLLRQRAELRCLAGEVSRAIVDWDDAGRCDPTLLVVDLERAECLARDGEYRSASFFLGRYLEANPSSGRGHLVEARVLFALGEPAEAARHFDAALTHVGAQPDDYADRARAYRAAGQIDTAVSGLDAAIRQMGAVPILVEMATQFDVERRSFPAALARLDRLPPNMARSETWLLRRATILEQAGDADAARRAFAATVAAAAGRSPDRRNQPAIKEVVAAASDGLTRLAQSEEHR